ESTSWDLEQRRPSWSPDQDWLRKLESALRESVSQTPRPGDGTSDPGPAGGLPSLPGYRLVSVLGQGGMGVVYEAIQEGLARRVALKTLRGDKVSGELMLRLRREASAIARLNHPHIVQIFEVGEWRPAGAGMPLPFLAMELVEGQSLSQWATGQPQS